MGESGYSYWFVLTRSNTNPNLMLKAYVAEPLNRDQADSAGVTYYTVGTDTNVNADMCCRLSPEWSELLCVAKTITYTSGCSVEGKAKLPAYSLEENRHLQYRLFDMLLLTEDGVRGPHCLGNDRSSAYDRAVEKRRRRVVETSYWNVSSDRTDLIGMTFAVGIRQTFDRWKGVDPGLQ